MKKAIHLSLIGIVLGGVSFTNPPDKFVGRWQPNLGPGTAAVSVFRADGTFDIFLNGKTFVSGKYRVSQDTLSISDPICGPGYYGSYQLTYITEDSVRQTLIQDTCRVRRNSIASSPTLVRVKSARP
ncbi:hypothetical protein [Spirosoma sp.]|uniref:hypothetical protein n=1 Tax=Spirosoma sp. TaxID=1899569 RepID=UPI003B3B5687